MDVVEGLADLRDQADGEADVGGRLLGGAEGDLGEKLPGVQVRRRAAGPLRPEDQRLQGDARDEIRGEIKVGPLLAELVRPDDPGVLEAGERPRLLLEARGVPREGARKNLQNRDARGRSLPGEEGRSAPARRRGRRIS